MPAAHFLPFISLPGKHILQLPPRRGFKSNVLLSIFLALVTTSALWTWAVGLVGQRGRISKVSKRWQRTLDILLPWLLENSPEPSRDVIQMAWICRVGGGEKTLNFPYTEWQTVYPGNGGRKRQKGMAGGLGPCQALRLVAANSS